MKFTDTLFVAGHRGLAGSAIVRQLRDRGFNNIVTADRKTLDLRDASATDRFFAGNQPDAVFLAAATVGGIGANSSRPADFILDNLQIEMNVMRSAHRHGVRQLVFLGSTCIYPRDCPQPIREEYFLTGPLEPTNSAYAIAKIAGIEMCRSFNLQYGTDFRCVMPTNLYGPGDNYDLEGSHVLAALVRKFAEAVDRSLDEVVVWGSGRPTRDFLHADDAGRGIVQLALAERAAFQCNGYPILNIGSGKEISIADLAALIAVQSGFTGRVRFDPSKPDGTPRKVTDITQALALGWHPTILLEEGIEEALREVRSRFCPQYLNANTTGIEVKPARDERAAPAGVDLLDAAPTPPGSGLAATSARTSQ